MSPELPKRPNLDHLRGQAKELLKALHQGDREAALVFIEYLPSAKKLTPAGVRSAGFRLADAQSALSRKTGFSSWPSLARHVRTLKALEGEWRFVHLETDGAKMPKAAFDRSRILIDGDCFRTESPEADYEGFFTIDVEAEPPRIDIDFVEGPEAGERSSGIFTLEGGRLTLCLGLVGSSRPRRFATSKGSGHALEELRRVSGARPAKVTGGEWRAPRETANGEQGEMEAPVDARAFEAEQTPLMRRLAGEWRPVEFVRDGQKMQEDWLAYGSRTNTGNETRIVFGGQTMLHARMRIDEDARPMAVDYLNLSGAAKGRVTFGIMEWSGEDLTFHTAAVGKPRPRSFLSARGGATTLSRWRRVT